MELLPQPGGREGRAPVLVVEDVDDLVVPHLELRVEANKVTVADCSFYTFVNYTLKGTLR